MGREQLEAKLYPKESVAALTIDSVVLTPVHYNNEEASAYMAGWNSALAAVYRRFFGEELDA
jgi:hypothetical protein